MALLLKRRGVQRVRPLEGGFDAWRAAGHPVEPYYLVDSIDSIDSIDSAGPTDDIGPSGGG